MDRFKRQKCGNIEIYVKERYENQKTQKLRDTRGKIINEVVSEDVIYQCACNKCNDYFEFSGERRNYGEKFNDAIYELL